MVPAVPQPERDTAEIGDAVHQRQPRPRPDIHAVRGAEALVGTPGDLARPHPPGGTGQVVLPRRASHPVEVDQPRAVRGPQSSFDGDTSPWMAPSPTQDSTSSSADSSPAPGLQQHLRPLRAQSQRPGTPVVTAGCQRGTPAVACSRWKSGGGGRPARSTLRGARAGSHDATVSTPYAVVTAGSGGQVRRARSPRGRQRSGPGGRGPCPAGRSSLTAWSPQRSTTVVSTR